MILQNNKTNNDLSVEKKSTDFYLFMKFYALPVASTLFFVVLIAFGALPNIKKTFSYNQQLTELKDQDAQLQKRINQLVVLQSQTAENTLILEKINEIVPTGKSEVVKFRERVANNTIQQNLSLNDSKAGENINSTLVTIDNFSLIQIPSEFNVNGRFPNMRQFLKKLYVGTDFFIVNKMNLSLASEQDSTDWLGNFNLTKYQFFADEGFDSQEVFANVSELTSANQEVIDFLKERFINNTLD